MPASARDFTTLAVERHDDGLAVLSFAVPDHGHNVLTPAALRETLEDGFWAILNSREFVFNH